MVGGRGLARQQTWFCIWMWIVWAELLFLCCIAVVSDGPDMVDMCVSVRCSVSSSRLSLSMGLDHRDTPLCCKHPTCQVVQHFTNLCRYRSVRPYLLLFNPVTRYGVVMVYWNHHVLSVYVQALPRRHFLKCPTFCNHSWYCGATLQKRWVAIFRVTVTVKTL